MIIKKHINVLVIATFISMIIVASKQALCANTEAVFASAQRGKGLALLIGISKLDSNHYDGSWVVIPPAENDAKTMKAIAVSRGFNATMLLTKDATYSRVTKEIQKAAQILKSGDTFLVFFSGHGHRLKDCANCDEADGWDETWCLYDGMIVDDKLAQLWTKFSAGVRIVLILDSCHSGTAFKKRIVPVHSWALARNPCLQFASPVKGLSYATGCRTVRRNWKFYRTIAASTKGDECVLRKIKCSLIVLSACADSKRAYFDPNATNSQFTFYVNEVWRVGAHTDNYPKFFAEIKRQMPDSQVPVYSFYGKQNSNFECSRVFSR